jgi:hypothetical protein
VSRAIAQFLETGSGSGPKIESELPDAIRLPAGVADGPDGGYGNTTEWGNEVRMAVANAESSHYPFVPAAHRLRVVHGPSRDERAYGRALGFPQTVLWLR